MCKNNNDIAIVRPTSSLISCLHYTESNVAEHKHYFDVITGQWLTNSEDCANPNGVLKVVNVEEIGSILHYLTEEEIKKTNDGTITDNDIISILYRIKQSLQAEEMSIKTR